MLYPPLEPHRQGYLQTEGSHRIYFEVCGNPSGMPVLFLHGGPGSSINPGHRRFFDPQFFRVVLFDQRGCGRSTPRGSVEANTTQHLLQDVEQLRGELGVDRWMLFGGSWGSTLALAYAQAHSARVRGLVLRGVFLASQDELSWYLNGLRHFMPEAWHAFANGIERTNAHGVIDWYAAEVFGGDRSRAQAAARRWTAYENAVMAVGEAASSGGGVADGELLLDRVRVQLHYLRSACFLPEQALLDNIARIAHLPAILVQGRRDLVCPPSTAHEVHRRWPGSQLRIVEEAGHSAMHPAMTAALVQAARDMQALFQRGRL